MTNFATNFATKLSLYSQRRSTSTTTEDAPTYIRMLAESVTGSITTTGQVQKTLETVVERLDFHESLLQGTTKRHRK